MIFSALIDFFARILVCAIAFGVVIMVIGFIILMIGEWKDWW